MEVVDGIDVYAAAQDKWDGHRPVSVCRLDKIRTQEFHGFQSRKRLEYRADQHARYPFRQVRKVLGIRHFGNAVYAFPAFGYRPRKQPGIADASTDVQLFGHVRRARQPNPVPEFHREPKQPTLVFIGPGKPSGPRAFVQNQPCKPTTEHFLDIVIFRGEIIRGCNYP